MGSDLQVGGARDSAFSTGSRVTQALLAHAPHFESQWIIVSKGRVTLCHNTAGQQRQRQGTRSHRRAGAPGCGKQPECAGSPAVLRCLPAAAPRCGWAHLDVGVRMSVYCQHLGRGASLRLPASSVCRELRLLVGRPQEGAPWREPHWLSVPQNQDGLQNGGR